MKLNIIDLKDRVNGIEELKTLVGTRTEIYNFIRKQNPTAIVDYRNALVKINGTSYLVVLKKVNGAFKISMLWDITNTYKEYYEGGCIVLTNQYWNK